jgi:magnesium chelatase subunit I
LRPQLLDRFGLSVDVRTPTDIAMRVEAVKRRDAFDRDPDAFAMAFAADEDRLRRKITAARKLVPTVDVEDDTRRRVAELCVALGTDGLRGELTLLRAARAVAALDKARTATMAHVKSIAMPALRHRLRRNPLDEVGSGVRIERALAEVLG